MKIAIIRTDENEFVQFNLPEIGEPEPFSVLEGDGYLGLSYSQIAFSDFENGVSQVIKTVTICDANGTPTTLYDIPFHEIKHMIGEIFKLEIVN